MISVDTNVILAALAPNEAHHETAVRRLRDLGTDRPLVISPVVRAELLATRDPAPALDFLAIAKIPTAWSMPPEAWTLAGEAFGRYALLRRAGKLPRRLLADFLIAAHAQHHGYLVLTFDTTVYDAAFPQLLAQAS